MGNYLQCYLVLSIESRRKSWSSHTQNFVLWYFCLKAKNMVQMANVCDFCLISTWSSRIFLIPTSSFTQAVVFFLYKLGQQISWIMNPHSFFSPAIVSYTAHSHLVAIMPGQNQWLLSQVVVPSWQSLGFYVMKMFLNNSPQCFHILIVAIVVRQEKGAKSLATVGADNLYDHRNTYYSLFFYDRKQESKSRMKILTLFCFWKAFCSEDSCPETYFMHKQ